MTPPLPVGVVGVGHLGRHHARLYAALRGAKLVGVVDVDAERARSIAAEYGCEVFDGLDAMMPHVRAASVAVPTVSHCEVGERLLAAGVHVLVEKPIASSLDEADALIAAARQGGSTLMVGHTERFNPAVRAMTRSVDAPRFMEIHRLAGFSARSTDIDVVLDLMIHDLDLLLYLDGTEVVSVDAVGVSALTDKVDIANARIRLQSGCVANLTASRISAEPVRRIRIFQSRTYLSCDTVERKVERYRLDLTGGNPQIVHDRLPVESEEPLAAELAAFVEGVAAGAGPPIDGPQGRRALDLAFRVREAIERLAAER